MADTLQKLVEITDQSDFGHSLPKDCAGLIVPFALQDALGHQTDLNVQKRFVRIAGDFAATINAPGFNLPDGIAGIAIDAPRGTIDIDHASALLRVYEAAKGLKDRSIDMITYLYPAITALAEQSDTLHASPRLLGLALDEPALAKTANLAAPDRKDAAPLLHARARLVAHARRLNLPAYLKPLGEMKEDQARQDGFDGIIGAPAFLKPAQ